MAKEDNDLVGCLHLHIESFLHSIATKTGLYSCITGDSNTMSSTAFGDIIFCNVEQDLGKIWTKQSTIFP